MKLKVLSLILMIVIMSGFLAACGSKQTASSDDSASEIEDSTMPQELPPKPEQERYHPVKEDLDDYTFKMVQDGGLEKQWYICGDDEDTRNVLDLAFYNRNTYVENFYNINIKLKTLGADQYQMGAELTTCVNSGEDFADVIFAVAQYLMPTAIRSGHVLDLLKADGFNLEASYWDQRIQSQYAINGKLFTLEGDYTVYDELCTFVVFYNGMLWGKYEYYDTYGSPYDLVRDHKWTLDLMLQMIKDKSDINNVDHMNASNQWGMISEAPMPYILYLGSGNAPLRQGETGELELLFTDRTVYANSYNIFEDTIKRISMNNEVFLIEPAMGQGVVSGWGEVFRMFMNDQALFYTPTLLTVTYLQDMKEMMGVLPIPLYTEEQRDYYSWTSAQSHLPLMVPATALSHLDTTAKIMETLCYFSKYSDSEKTQTVVDAEYEWFMINKVCRTDEDREMLELIFSQRAYDLDYALQITGVSEKVVYDNSMGKRIDTLSSNLSRLQASAMANLTKFLREMKENLKN